MNQTGLHNKKYEQVMMVSHQILFRFSALLRVIIFLSKRTSATTIAEEPYQLFFVKVLIILRLV